MSVLSNSKAIESEKIAFNNTSSSEADFESGCKGISLITTADVYIAFDRPANTDDFLLTASTSPLTLEHDWQFTKVSALGSSGSGTLYMLVRR